jgi:exopolyphosphatase/guanosine-5'-triphosphate,3'-diphosphate pyrophosphatase
MRKIAAIDIGTNSMRLLLCEYGNGKITKKQKHLLITRMGQNLSVTGAVSPEAIERNVKALEVFKQKASDFGAEKIIAIATSAVRDAKNRNEFLDAAKARTGIEVMVISGEDEADLGITGVLSELDQSTGDVLVIDIGGGSTELIYGSLAGIKYTNSINAGTVRMTEGFFTGHPIKQHEIENLENKLNDLFEKSIERVKEFGIKKAIGIGGTATTIAAIYHSLGIYDAQKVHNTEVDIDYLKLIFEKLKNMTVEQRYEVKGLQKERADVAPAGIYIMIHLLQNLGIRSFTASENDNLEGVVIKYA